MKDIKKLECPICDKRIEIIRVTNWDNLVTYCYPKCSYCGFTTLNTFDNEEQVIIYLEDVKG